MIAESKANVLDALSANDGEHDVIFTSGGTESNNWVIWSCVRRFERSNPGVKPHVVTSNVEHDSVRCMLEHLLEDGRIDVSWVAVDTTTMAVKAEDILEAVTDSTCLVTVMMANNETGAVQPIAEIGLALEQMNANRSGSNRVFFHSDIAQAVGKIRVDFPVMRTDFATVVGHKFYGPRIGAVVRRKSAVLLPMLHGGGQESGLRPGTENVPMIVGFGADRLKEKVKISRPELQLPNTVSVSFPKLLTTGAELLKMCKTFNASTGSACHSGSDRPSQVLLNSGYTAHDALRTLRLSVGTPTTEQDVDTVVDEIVDLVHKHSEPSQVLLNSGYTAHDALRTLRLSVGTPTTEQDVDTVVDEIVDLVHKHSE